MIITATTPENFIDRVRRRVTDLDGHDRREYDVSALMHHLEWEDESDCYTYDMQAVLADLDQVTLH